MTEPQIPTDRAIADLLRQFEPFSIEIPADVGDPALDVIVDSSHLFADAPGWMATASGTEFFVPCLPIIDSGMVLRPGIEPRVGDRLRVWQSEDGNTVGMMIENLCIYYFSAQDLAYRAAREAKLQEVHRQRVFVVRRTKMDQIFAELPAFFQRQIMDHRNADPRFRLTGEFSVLAAMKGATVLAQMYKQQNPGNPLQAWDDSLTEVGESSRSIENAKQMTDKAGLADALAGVAEDITPALVMSYVQDLLRHEKEQADA